MNHMNSWMNGWGGGGMWGWAVLGAVIVALLFVAISRRANK